MSESREQGSSHNFPFSLVGFKMHKRLHSVAAKAEELRQGYTEIPQLFAPLKATDSGVGRWPNTFSS
jgi:hypothetical protein